MLAGKDTRPFRGKATTVLSNDCGKFDETDQAHAMEGVLDSSRRENHWKMLWTWPKPKIARFAIKDAVNGPAGLKDIFVSPRLLAFGAQGLVPLGLGRDFLQFPGIEASGAPIWSRFRPKIMSQPTYFYFVIWPYIQVGRGLK